MSDIAADAFQHARIRTNAAAGRARGTMTMQRVGVDIFCPCSLSDMFKQDRTKTVLTMEDLSAALSDHGVNARKPEFYL